MAEQFLQAAQIRSRPQQMRRKAVAQRVGGGAGGQAEHGAGAGHGFLDHAL